jgi:hypothetical protein
VRGTTAREQWERHRGQARQRGKRFESESSCKVLGLLAPQSHHTGYTQLPHVLGGTHGEYSACEAFGKLVNCNGPQDGRSRRVAQQSSDGVMATDLSKFCKVDVSVADESARRKWPKFHEGRIHVAWSQSGHSRHKVSRLVPPYLAFPGCSFVHLY